MCNTLRYSVRQYWLNSCRGRKKMATYADQTIIRENSRTSYMEAALFNVCIHYHSITVVGMFDLRHSYVPHRCHDWRELPVRQGKVTELRRAWNISNWSICLTSQHLQLAELAMHSTVLACQLMRGKWNVEINFEISKNWRVQREICGKMRAKFFHKYSSAA